MINNVYLYEIVYFVCIKQLLKTNKAQTKQKTKTKPNPQTKQKTKTKPNPQTKQKTKTKPKTKQNPQTKQKIK